MPSLPSLPPAPVPAATAVQTRSVAPDDRSPPATEHSAAPGAAGAATRNGSAASGQVDISGSFEAVLEAQFGSPSESKGVSLLQPLADGVASGAKTEKSKSDAGGAVAGPPTLPFFLPTNTPLAHSSTANAAGDAVLSANLDVQSRGAALAEALRSEPGLQLTQAPLSGEARSASFADTLQSLPLLDHAPKHDLDFELASQPGVPEPIAPAPPVIFEHRLDATQALQQSNGAIPGRVGEPGWGNAFSQRVSWMVGQQMQSAEFRVEPPQLGPIEVRLSMANDQASLTIVASHAAARDAIQTSLPRLQEMLLESGVSLGNVFVGSQMPQGQHDTGARERALGGASADIGTVAGIDPSGIVVSRLLGLVDLYA